MPVKSRGILVVLFGFPVWFLLFPVLAVLGGSVQLWNWGPGLLIAGLSLLALLASSSSRGPWGGPWFTAAFVGVLLLLGARAALTPAQASGAHDGALLLLALTAYLIGRAGQADSTRAVMLGLAVATLANSAAAIIQLQQPEWSPLYPARAGAFPSGFFAHYNHSANFGLGAAGLFFSSLLRSRGNARVIPGIGLVSSVLTVMLSLSRGGNFSLVCVGVIGLALAAARLKRRGTGIPSLWAVVACGALLIVPLGRFAVEKVAGFRGKATLEAGFADGGRLSFYDAAWKLFLEHPLVGGGAGSFGREVYRVLPADFDLGAEPEMAHNELLQLLGDYGAPVGLALVILLLWPAVKQCYRYLLGRSSGGGVWESLGLAGMLIQSNFDFVFHVAPCAFLAAFILGRISRSRWTLSAASEWDELRGISPQRAEEFYQAAGVAEKAGGSEENFLHAARNYALAFLAGRPRAELRLIVLLLSSREDQWQRHANDLVIREKMRDGKGMAVLMRKIVEDCEKGREGRRALLERLALKQEKRRPRAWGLIFRNLVVGLFALLIVGAGLRLTDIARLLWRPLYEPGVMSEAQRFEVLLAVHEASPYLGLERKVLSLFVDRLYGLSTLEAREYWASSYYRRLLAVAGGAGYDPVVALQVATVAGWAGDEWQATALYDGAIRMQSVHERIFMSHFFKAEYHYDLMLSFDAEGRAERAREYAALAAEGFRRSLQLAPYGGVHQQRRQELAAACDEVRSGRAP
jgi:O-antigen ligase